MKMISSVNPRSMRLVTFISAIGCDCLGRLKVLAMGASSFSLLGLELDPVREGARVVLELRDQALRHREEHVVAEEAWYRHQEARDGREERGGDAGGEGLYARRLLHGDRAEGVHDAPHRYQEPEEGRTRHDRGQEDHARLVAQRLERKGALQ